MKGNNEGEEGGISIASRKTLAASTELRVLPAQDGAVSVDQENRRSPLGARVTALGGCHWRADEMKQALALGGGNGPRGETCAAKDDEDGEAWWRISRAVARAIVRCLVGRDRLRLGEVDYDYSQREQEGLHETR